MSQAPPSIMQMQPNWSNLPGSANAVGSLSTGNVVNNNITSQIEAINAQQLTLQEQIRQSEQNLTAQHNVMLHTLKSPLNSLNEMEFWMKF